MVDGKLKQLHLVATVSSLEKQLYIIVKVEPITLLRRLVKLNDPSSNPRTSRSSVFFLCLMVKEAIMYPLITGVLPSWIYREN